jgi:hypothetical protein
MKELYQRHSHVFQVGQSEKCLFEFGFFRVHGRMVAVSNEYHCL